MTELPARRQPRRSAAPRPGMLAEASFFACACPWMKARPGRRDCGPSCTARASYTLCDPQHHACTNGIPNRKGLRQTPFKARGGMGSVLLTTARIAARTRVLAYGGRVVRTLTKAMRKEAKAVRLGGGMHLVAEVGKGHGLGQYLANSCDPSCVLELYSYRGATVPIVTAIKEIQPNTMPTISYGWTRGQWAATQARRCLCGSSRCVSGPK